MRTYGRVPVDPILDPKGPTKWVVVETDANGLSDVVYITALAQTLKLNLNESPFWANFGIPARQSVMQQIHPDLYVALTQQYYSRFFASLTVAKVPVPEPVYDLFVITHAGVSIPPIRVHGFPQ